MALTQEQQRVVDTVCSSTDNRIIAVNSVLLIDILEKLIY